MILYRNILTKWSLMVISVITRPNVHMNDSNNWTFLNQNVEPDPISHQVLCMKTASVAKANAAKQGRPLGLFNCPTEVLVSTVRRVSRIDSSPEMNLPHDDENQALGSNSSRRSSLSPPEDNNGSPRLSPSTSREEDIHVRVGSDVRNEIFINELERTHMRLQAENAQIRSRLEATLAENRGLMQMMAQEPQDPHLAASRYPRSLSPENILLGELVLSLLNRWEQLQVQQRAQAINLVSDDSHTSDTDSDEDIESQPGHCRKKQRTKK